MDLFDIFKFCSCYFYQGFESYSVISRWTASKHVNKQRKNSFINMTELELSNQQSSQRILTRRNLAVMLRQATRPAEGEAKVPIKP